MAEEHTQHQLPTTGVWCSVCIHDNQYSTYCFTIWTPEYHFSHSMQLSLMHSCRTFSSWYSAGYPDTAGGSRHRWCNRTAESWHFGMLYSTLYMHSEKTYSEKNTNLDYKIPGSIKLEQWPIKWTASASHSQTFSTERIRHIANVIDTLMYIYVRRIPF